MDSVLVDPHVHFPFSFLWLFMWISLRPEGENERSDGIRKCRCVRNWTGKIAAKNPRYGTVDIRRKYFFVMLGRQRNALADSRDFWKAKNFLAFWGLRMTFFFFKWGNIQIKTLEENFPLFPTMFFHDPIFHGWRRLNIWVATIFPKGKTDGCLTKNVTRDWVTDTDS